MQKNFFGPHWHLDAKGIDPKKIMDRDLIEAFMLRAVEVAHMKVIAGPLVIYYDHPTREKESGVSGILILADSHFSLHSFINDGFLFLDLFSCDEFDPKELNQLLVDTFAPKDYTYRVDYRGEGYER